MPERSTPSRRGRSDPDAAAVPWRDLSALWDPRSIAVVGASADATKWGGEIALRFARTEKRRPLYFVNRRGGTVCGLPAYPSLSDLPEAPQMVYFAMPAAAFEATLDEALGMGVRAIVGIFAGLGETGAEGKERERAAAERVRAAGALMIGPNCMGVADTTVAFQGVATLDIPPGHIGWVTMSGAMGEEFVARARAASVGFSRFVNLGNQADVSIAEVLLDYREHQATHVVAVYAEDMKDGRGLARAIADLEQAGKPVVFMAPGRSAASVRAARSHTGSLAPDSAVLDAVARATGMVLVDDPGEFFDTTVALLNVVGLHGSCRRDAGRDDVRPGGSRVRLPAGRRVGIVSEGGGHGGMAADAAAAAGLEVPQLSNAAIAALREGHAPSTGVNPIDFAIGTTDPDAYARTIPALARSGEIDAVLAVGQLGYWATRFPECREQVKAEVEGAHRAAAAVREAGVPLAWATVYPDSAPARALRECGVPVYREIRAAARALGRLADHALADPTGVPNAPAAEALLQVAPAGDDQGSVALDYWAARDALVRAGMRFAPAHLVAASEEAAAVAAGEVGYPVAVKAQGVLHKSDVGGVALGLSDEAKLRAAVAGMAARLGVTTVSVERMAPVAEGVEVIIGCRWDARFGPLLLVGVGGIYAELLRDVRTALAPVTEQQAEVLLRQLRGAALLTGARGRLALDLGAAARAAALLSRFAAAHPEIAEVEVNPLLVLPEGALALDARILLRDARQPVHVWLEGLGHGAT